LRQVRLDYFLMVEMGIQAQGVNCLAY